jgi:hypothetical protein
MPKGKLTRIPADRIPLKRLQGKAGVQGATGLAGKDGVGTQGERGRAGKDGVGRDGRDGVDGVNVVQHVYEKPPEGFVTNETLKKEITKLEREIELIKISSAQGGRGFVGGNNGPVPVTFNTYHAVTTNEYHVTLDQLLMGTNIFGVQVDGTTTIYIPDNLDSRIVLVVNDETGNAGTNNITIQVET